MPQAAALEVLAETISLRHGHALLLDTSEPGRAELWECIRKLCIAARGVPHSVRFAACSIFGHFLQASKFLDAGTGDCLPEPPRDVVLW